MIAYSEDQLYRAIEAKEPLIRVIRGRRYDMRNYGPAFIEDGTTIRALDGGSNTAIIYYPIAKPEKKWTNGFYEELWQVGSNVTMEGMTMDMGLHASELSPEMIQCAVRVIGERCTFRNVHVTNCLKWGMEIVHNLGHYFTGGSCTNITYKLTHDPNPFTGYSYGLWFSGTNSGVPPAEEDITLIEDYSFDLCRNGVDCSQAGNSLALHRCKFGYCEQSGFDTHSTYGIHDLTLNECEWRGKDSQANFRIHKLTGKLTLTNNRSAESTWYLGDGVPHPGGYLQDMDSGTILIQGNDWRYDFA